MSVTPSAPGTILSLCQSAAHRTWYIRHTLHVCPVNYEREDRVQNQGEIQGQRTHQQTIAHMCTSLILIIIVPTTRSLVRPSPFSPAQLTNNPLRTQSRPMNAGQSITWLSQTQQLINHPTRFLWKFFAYSFFPERVLQRSWLQQYSVISHGINMSQSTSSKIRRYNTWVCVYLLNWEQ